MDSGPSNGATILHDGNVNVWDGKTMISFNLHQNTLNCKLFTLVDDFNDGNAESWWFGPSHKARRLG
jgi:hypothetical protein